MNTDQFKHFALVYKLRSFALAASQVPMSPQGLAKSIRKLEQEFDVEFFEADASGARVPTEFGDRMMDFVNEAELQRVQLVWEFDRIRARRQKRVRVASCLGISGFIGLRLKEAFEAQNPDVRIDLIELSDDACDEAISLGRVDLGFTLAPFDGRLANVPLFTEPFYLWINAKDSRSMKECVTMRDLDGACVSSFGDGIKCDAVLRKKLAEAGSAPTFFNSPEVYWHYENALLNRSIGLTVQHFVALKAFCASDEVRAVPLDDLNWSIGLSYIPSHVFAEHEARFVDFVTTHAEAMAIEARMSRC